MAFNADTFLAHCSELQNSPQRDLQVAFWDLETVDGFEPAELLCARFAVGYRSFDRQDERGERAAYAILRRLDETYALPVSVRAVLYATFAGVVTDDTGRSWQWLAAQLALNNLSKARSPSDLRVFDQFGGREALALALAERFAAVNDEIAEAGVFEQIEVQGVALVRFQIRRAIRRGDLHEAFALAVEDLRQSGDPTEAEWIEALLERDYRKLKRWRSPEATFEGRLLVWLMVATYPVAGTAPRALASPSHLRRSQELPAAMAPLLKAALKIEEVLDKESADRAVDLLSTEFTKWLASIVRVDYRLLAMLAASKAAKRAGANDVAAHFANLFEVTSYAVSHGVSRDLLLSRGVQAEAALPAIVQPRATHLDFATARLPRGFKVSASVIKLLGSLSLARLQLKLTKDSGKHETIKATIQAAARRFVGEISELRGALQKVAQLGFVAHGDLPYEWRDEMARGLTHGLPMDKSSLRIALEKAYGDPARVFVTFAPDPFACGSIGQVHRAVTTDGREVCVKVRYPGIEASIRSDFSNIRTLAPLMSLLFPNQPLKELVSSWERASLIECDFYREAAQYESVRKALANCPVDVPATVPGLCTEAVLVTEYIEGQDFFDFAASASPSERYEIGIWLWRSLYRLLRAKMFRADVQPANYKVRRGRLVMLDFGSMLCDAELDVFPHLEFMRKMALGDVPGMAETFVKDGWATSEDAAHAAKVIAEVLGRPFRGDFEFTESYTREVYVVMTRTLGRRLTMPLGNENLVRVFWSLFSMLATLRARANWLEVLSEELDIRPSELKKSA